MLATAATGAFWVVVGPWAVTLVGVLVLSAVGYSIHEMRKIRQDLEEQIEATSERIKEVYRSVQTEYVKKDTIEIRLDSVIKALSELKYGQEMQAKEVREIRDRLIRVESIQ